MFYGANNVVVMSGVHQRRDRKR